MNSLLSSPRIYYRAMLLFLSCPIVFSPNASYCLEAKGMSYLVSFFFQGNKNPAKLAAGMMKNSILASTAGPVLQDST